MSLREYGSKIYLNGDFNEAVNSSGTRCIKSFKLWLLIDYINTVNLKNIYEQHFGCFGDSDNMKL